MTQNACPANAKVSEGSSPYSHPSAPDGSDQMDSGLVGGSFDLLEGLRKVLVELAEIEWGQERESIVLPQNYSTTIPMRHLERARFFLLAWAPMVCGGCIEGLCAGSPTLRSIFNMCVFSLCHWT